MIIGGCKHHNPKMSSQCIMASILMTHVVRVTFYITLYLSRYVYVSMIKRWTPIREHQLSRATRDGQLLRVFIHRPRTGAAGRSSAISRSTARVHVPGYRRSWHITTWTGIRTHFV
jgi:hypothetical protein